MIDPVTTYLDSTLVGNGMSKIIKLFMVITVAFSLWGCDLLFESRNLLDKKIQNIELNRPTKINDLIDGRWDTVCVLVPYQTFLKDDGSETVKSINKEIEDAKLSIDESHWHLILMGSEKISIISERVSNLFSVKQGGFNKFFSEKFFEANFKPLSCADFNESYFLKYGQNKSIYLSLGVKIL